MIIISFIKQLSQRFFKDHVLDLAAQCAYYFLLSIFPFLIFAVALLGFLHISSDDVITMLYQYVPDVTVEMISRNLTEILDSRRTGLLSFGFILTIWSASHAISALIRSLNRAYDVPESRPFLQARFVAILLTISMIFVIIIALLLPVFGKLIIQWITTTFGLPETTAEFWNNLRWFLSFIILTVAFTFLYILGPNEKLTFREVIVGAVFASTGWQMSSLGFSYYVNHLGNFTATYGGIGGVIVLMMWFHLSAALLIIGGQINAILRETDAQSSI
ncbi:YihY/virulence factor BrkB family protein [Desertibacillus haloalkaliphilus]|uniref:YihY/virulence factor BrkB family protein n=1 Tax=Desertibacillus haloalkaliphilus TaxID=1328930 RepID=UPI0028AF2836|nr:YihY/virulence factor BrkB family protein [Desertibacillus haloalkaliphilus]